MILDRSKRNVLLLALCQAMYGSATGLMIATSPLVGYALLAENKGLATLPLAIHHLGVMSATIPASHLMRRLGRRAGFMIAAVLGMIGAVIAAQAVLVGSFVLFCVGVYVIGWYSGFAVFYRFAAADTADEAFRPKAISLVLAGGLLAAFIGPELAKATKDLMAPIMFAGSYFALVGLFVVSLIVVAFVDIPRLTVEERRSSGRPLGVILRQPACIVAMLSGMVGYGVMSLVMTSTPLAMAGCGFGFGDSATVIQFHIFAMFAPSFFTGSIVARIGPTWTIVLGIVLNILCVGVNLAGIEFMNFSIALILLGVGWNFMFIGATTLLTRVHAPAERAKVQGLNDFLIFGTIAAASLSSGGVLHFLGWDIVNLGVLPLLGVALLATLWLHWRQVSETAEPAE